MAAVDTHEARIREILQINERHDHSRSVAQYVSTLAEQGDAEGVRAVFNYPYRPRDINNECFLECIIDELIIQGNLPAIRFALDSLNSVNYHHARRRVRNRHDTYKLTPYTVEHMLQRNLTANVQMFAMIPELHMTRAQLKRAVVKTVRSWLSRFSPPHNAPMTPAALETLRQRFESLRTLAEIVEERNL